MHHDRLESSVGSKQSAVGNGQSAVVMINTGPAIDEEEAEALAALMRHPKWPYFAQYLNRIKAEAIKRTMSRLDQPLETQAYWKAAHNICDDLVTLPEGIGKQIYQTEEDEDEG